MNASRSKTSQANTTAATNEFPIYEEIQEPRENQSTANCPASRTTYVVVQSAPKTSNKTLAKDIVYAELDL